MPPMSLALAIALITAPSDAPAPEGLSYLRPTIQALAIHWEILDKRESQYILSGHDQFETDMGLLRQRWHDLKDAPSLHDAMRFPDRALINDMLSFNRDYKRHLEAHQEMDQVNWWELREAIVETDRLYNVWDDIRDCKGEFYYVTVRRQALKKIRDTLGYAAYSSGALPPHVPVWRFGRLR